MKRYFSSIKRYVWVVLVSAILTTAIGYAFAKVQPPVYQASATLLVNADTVANPLLPSLTSYDSIGLAANYSSQIMSRSVMDFVYQSDPKLKLLNYNSDFLLGSVSAANSATASTITITSIASNGSDAILLANDVANGFQAYLQQQIQKQLDGTRTNLNNQIAAYQKDKASWAAQIIAINNNSDPRLGIYNSNLQDDVHNIDLLTQQLSQLPAVASTNLSVIQLATPFDVTATTKTSLIVGATFLVGLVVGLVIMLLLIFLDNRLRDEAQVKEKLGLAYLGGISGSSKLKGNLTQISGKTAEQFTNISANLALTGIFPGEWHAPRGAVLLVTSPRAAEGKTTLAVALATTVARAGNKVVVVDGNLRQPSTHLAFGMNPSGPGVSGLLKAAGADAADDAVVRSNVPGIWVLPAGPQMENPTLLLEQKLPAILERLCQKADLVIIDGPSLLSAADALILAKLANGVALVVDIRHDKLPMLLRSKEMVSTLAHTPVGIILNHLPNRGSDSYYATSYTGKSEIPAQERISANGGSNGNGKESWNGQKLDFVAAMPMVKVQSPLPPSTISDSYLPPSPRPAVSEPPPPVYSPLEPPKPQSDSRIAWQNPVSPRPSPLDIPSPHSGPGNFLPRPRMKE